MQKQEFEERIERTVTDEHLRNAQREVQRIQEEIEELSCPTLRVEE